jgi:hypothetical protein
MADSKKSSLLQAVGKLKSAKRNSPNIKDDGNTKSTKRLNSDDGTVSEKIRNSVSKFDRD